MYDIELITTTKGVSERGNEVENEKSFDCLGVKTDAKRDEFYRAMMAGTKASAVIAIWKDDYEESVLVSENEKMVPEKVRCDGIEYKIVRKFEKGEKVILTCEECM